MKNKSALEKGQTRLSKTGWLEYSIWDHSTATQELYRRRCQKLELEMTCAAQAAELLQPLIRSGESLLDAGCGSGYFYHSLTARAIPATYYGIDASPTMISIGQRILPAFGLAPERLQLLRIEDFNGEVDHVVCMNVLSNLDSYHRPLERLLRCARQTVVVRESLHDTSQYRYVFDNFLDHDVSLKTYVNTYSLSEVIGFIESYGYKAEVVTDRYTGGQPQLVVGYPHYWAFVVARRR